MDPVQASKVVEPGSVDRVEIVASEDDAVGRQFAVLCSVSFTLSLKSSAVMCRLVAGIVVKFEEINLKFKKVRKSSRCNKVRKSFFKKFKIHIQSQLLSKDSR